MLFKKKRKKYEFEKILEAFKPYKKDYAIIIEQEDAKISVNIESLVKPSKPPKRSSTSLKSGKTNEKEKAD